MSNDNADRPSDDGSDSLPVAFDSPEEMMFNANLQEFAVRVGTICALEAGGKLSSDDAYQSIKELWKTLKRSRKTLGVGNIRDEPA